MNKLLMFPIAFMGLFAIYGMIWTGQTYQSSTGGYDSPTGYVDPYAGDVNTSYASEKDFTSTGLILILSLAIAGGIIAGVKFLGSGLSDTSQQMIFQITLFGTLWAVFSIMAATFLYSNILGVTFWTILTLMYVIGIGSQISNSGGA